MNEKYRKGYFLSQILLVVCLNHSMLVFAEEALSSSKRKNDEVLPTNQWLELQRSGQQASPDKQTLSGPVLQNTYERYKKSFTHPIPAEFKERNASTIR